MPNNYFLTPEETMRRKERKKKILYVSIILFSIILSAGVTVLANQL